MKICFYGNLFSALSDKINGGGELQQIRIAKFLLSKNIDVTIVDFHAKMPDGIYEGIQFYFAKNHIPSIISISYFRLLLSISADIYFGRIRSYHHIIPFIAARKLNKKFVLSIAHDLDVSTFFERWKYYYKEKSIFYLLSVGVLTEICFYIVLRKADLILVQHEGQYESSKLKNKSKLLFRNIFDFSKLKFEPTHNTKFDYLYIGALNLRKGFDNLAKTLKAIPQKKIVIIGRPYGSKHNSKLYDSLRTLQHVIFIKYANQQEIFSYLNNCKALISTSSVEGFPNVFLEAWALGKPVISLNTNPGNIFEKYELGICCQGKLSYFIEILRSNDLNYDAKNIINYVKTFHDPAKNLDELIHADIFRNI
jgi:glycosyltransferase involved in cell wall biosynthesis